MFRNKLMALRSMALASLLLAGGCSTSSDGMPRNSAPATDLSGRAIEFSYIAKASNVTTGKSKNSHIKSALQVLKDGKTFLFFAEGNNKKGEGVEIKSVGRWYSHEVFLPSFGAPSEYRAKVGRSGDRIRLDTTALVKYGMTGPFTQNFSFIFDIQGGRCEAKFVSYRASGSGLRGVRTSPGPATCSIR